MQLKTPQQLIESLELCECEHISGDLQTERIAQTITQDRADIHTSLVAAVEGQKYVEPRSERAKDYNRGLDDILTIINSIFKE